MIHTPPTVAQMTKKGMSKEKQKELIAYYKQLNEKEKHWDTADPVTITDTYWVDVVRKNNERYPNYNCKSGGKWLIFVDNEKAHKVWKTIKKATQNELLGPYSKCSTGKKNPNSKDDSKQVICVYTCDSENAQDVMRVRHQLTKLGIDWKLPYKTDQAAREKKYQVNGSTRISKYYC